MIDILVGTVEELPLSRKVAGRPKHFEKMNFQEVSLDCQVEEKLSWEMIWSTPAPA